MNGRTKKSVKSVVCAGIVILALVGCATAPAAIVTTTYEFIPDQSTVQITGWFGETYFIEGQFQLTVDFDEGIASFDQVDATLSAVCFYFEDGEEFYTESLGVLFRMTELESTYVSDTQIDFLLERNIPTFPGSDIHIVLTFMDDSVHLAGGFGPPIFDGPYYTLDAVAVPDPATLILLSLGSLMLRKRN